MVRCRCHAIVAVVGHDSNESGVVLLQPFGRTASRAEKSHKTDPEPRWETTYRAPATDQGVLFPVLSMIEPACYLETNRMRADMPDGCGGFLISRGIRPVQPGATRKVVPPVALPHLRYRAQPRRTD